MYYFPYVTCSFRDVQEMLESKDIFYSFIRLFTLFEVWGLSLDNYILNQIIKCLNQIISENKPYNLRLCTFTLHQI